MNIDGLGEILVRVAAVIAASLIASTTVVFAGLIGLRALIRLLISKEDEYAPKHRKDH